ncbi:MAG: prolipoprotein diacylglyceryl transferase [Holophagaceae bacterium]|nr:prolipoprotein diacylglyceryl transferase [Holophagaceae bacterium]
MHPYLFHIGSFGIGTYGLMMALAFFTALALAKRQGRLDGLSGEAVTDLAIAVLIAGVIGSKALMIIVGLLTPVGGDGHMAFRDIFTVGMLRAGGAVHGGIIAAAIVFFWKLRPKAGLPLRKTGDSLVPAVALGQAIGRIGCFMAGCCYGTSCDLPWAVTFTSPDAQQLSGTPLFEHIHPVQLYHFGTNLLICGILVLARRKRKFEGQIFSLYFILEGIGRVIVELWRGDLDRGAWLGQAWLTTGRLTAIGFIVLGIAIWAFSRKRLPYSPPKATPKEA